MTTGDALFGEEASTALEDRNFQLLLFANVVGVLGTALVSPILSSLIGPFGATPSSIGLMVSMFSAPGIVFIPVAGYLADHLGRKPVIMAGLATYGLAGGAISLTNDYQLVLGLRVLQGIGYAGIVPVVITMVGDLYTETEETAAQGLRFTTSGFSLTVFPLLAGTLVALGWQYPFLIYLFAIPVAVLIGVYLDEPSVGSSSRVEGGDGGRPEANDSGNPARREHARRLLHLASRPELVSIIVARSLVGVILIGFLTYVSIIVVELGGGMPRQAGVAVAINSIAFAATASQVGRLSARFSTIVPLAGSMVCLGFGFSLAAISAGLLPVLLGSAVLGMGLGVSQAIYRSIVTAYAPTVHRGALVSLTESSGRLATSLTPVVMGWFIATATPVVGFERAVRSTSVLVSAIGTFGGFICLLVWYRSRTGTGDA